MLLLFISSLALIVSMVGMVQMLLGHRTMRWLHAQPTWSGACPPKVLAVIPARNEETTIAHGVESILRQTYPNLEILVLNDRSSDRTGEVLDDLARTHPRLTVRHLTALPRGWLGKNHALYVGTLHGPADYFLFMDADVVLERDVLSRAVATMERDALDHATLAPRAVMPGFLLQLFAGTFHLLFGFYAQPWKARDPRSKRYIGVGAFNLVRASAYAAAGTHRAIAMRPDDDLMLGKLLKKNGGRQEILLASDLVSVEWYSSFHEVCRGLEKNAYAGLNYNAGLLLGATLAQVHVFVWPLIGLFLTSGPTRLINAATYLLWAWFYGVNGRAYGSNPWHGLMLPASVVLFLYVIWRASLLTLFRNGIDWRGTHYALRDLKANRV